MVPFSVLNPKNMSGDNAIPANSPGFPGSLQVFMKSPGLPVRAPNLSGTSYRGSFLFINFVGNVLLLH